MTKENENVSIANKSSYTEEEIKAAYEKGKSEGRIEGMLSYQKRLIKNLQQDNASLNQMLQEMKNNPLYLHRHKGPKTTLNQFNKKTVNLIYKHNGKLLYL